MAALLALPTGSRSLLEGVSQIPLPPFEVWGDWGAFVGFRDGKPWLHPKTSWARGFPSPQRGLGHHGEGSELGWSSEPGLGDEKDWGSQTGAELGLMGRGEPNWGGGKPGWGAA